MVCQQIKCPVLLECLHPFIRVHFCLENKVSYRLVPLLCKYSSSFTHLALFSLFVMRKLVDDMLLLEVFRKVGELNPPIVLSRLKQINV